VKNTGRVSTAQTPIRTGLLTALALLAFAANSLLCRLALGPGEIDAGSFTLLRLVSGAIVLVLLVSLSRGFGPRGRGGSWISGGMLFLYAMGFSLAYRSLAVGTGALLLFGAVQATMLLAALRSGERPHPWTWGGLGLALAGLCILVGPGLQAPSPGGAVLMIAAGIAWGIYSLRGRGAHDPLAATTDNFVRSVPLVFAAGLGAWLGTGPLHASPRGVLLAITSGAVTSGVGYVIWYAALRGLTATRAATVQLAVPILAALAGALLLGEAITVRLAASAAFILGGIAVVLREKAREAVTRARAEAEGPDPTRSAGPSRNEP